MELSARGGLRTRVKPATVCNIDPLGTHSGPPSDAGHPKRNALQHSFEVGFPRPMSRDARSSAESPTSHPKFSKPLFEEGPGHPPLSKRSPTFPVGPQWPPGNPQHDEHFPFPTNAHTRGSSPLRVTHAGPRGFSDSPLRQMLERKTRRQVLQSPRTNQ